MVVLVNVDVVPAGVSFLIGFVILDEFQMVVESFKNVLR